MHALPQRAFCEWLGTAFLLAAVVGSGIMAQKLAGDAATALLCNTLATGAILAVLILLFGPLSGAHFNPAVSVGFALRKELPWSESAAYIAAQVLGGLVGVWVAHLMFERPSPFLTPLGSIPRQPIGSRLRLHSLTPPSPLPGRFPTRLRG